MLGKAAAETKRAEDFCEVLSVLAGNLEVGRAKTEIEA
jgi:hypothetical protein